jgi:hypothetical protein
VLTEAVPACSSAPMRWAWLTSRVQMPAARAVVGLVGGGQNVLVVGEKHCSDDRPEDLLAHDPHVRRGVRQHGGLDEVAALTGAVPAGDRAGALRDASMASLGSRESE